MRCDMPLYLPGCGICNHTSWIGVYNIFCQDWIDCQCRECPDFALSLYQEYRFSPLW